METTLTAPMITWAAGRQEVGRQQFEPRIRHRQHGRHAARLWFRKRWLALTELATRHRGTETTRTPVSGGAVGTRNPAAVQAGAVDGPGTGPAAIALALDGQPTVLRSAPSAPVPRLEKMTGT